jgi:hypothetical protein
MKIFFQLKFFVFLSNFVQAQTTECSPDFLGGFKCTTSPSRAGDGFLDLGAYQRGVDAANQQYLMQQQIEMQRRLLDQQREIQFQQRAIEEANIERNAPEWQIGNLATRDETSPANGKSKCFYESPYGFFFVQNKRYGRFTMLVNQDEKCPLSATISKSTAQIR